MKYYSISLFIVGAILLLGQNVLSYFGFDDNRFQLLMLLLAFIPSIAYNHRWSKHHSLLSLVLFVVFFSLFSLLTDKGEGTRALAMTIIGAPILMTAFPLIDKNNIIRRNFWNKAFRVFLVLYLLEVLLAILERIMGHPIFGWHGISQTASISSVGVSDFRSTGMYGHPLYNALMVSTAMAFILVSDLKPKLKFLLWGLGYIAVLCFNTRGSIVGNALFMGVYIISTFVVNRKMSDSSKIAILILGLLMAGAAYFLMAQGFLGGRLMTMGLVDDSSAQVRIDIIEFVKGIPLDDYLFGMNFRDYTFLLFRNGLAATENFWIDYLFRYGLIFLVFYITLYFFYLKKELKNYKSFDRFYVTSAFLLIASTNNSLSSSFVALFYFLFLIRLFNPRIFHSAVNRDFLS